MLFTIIIRDYFIWHYTTAWKEVWHTATTGLWFVMHFFSIPSLLRSLFAPFKRMTETRQGRMDAEAILSAVVVNILSRLLGLLVRLTLISIGSIFLLTTLIIAILYLVIWLILPMLPIGLIAGGSSLLILSL